MKKIESVAKLNESLLGPTNFCEIFRKSFDQINKDKSHREIIGKNLRLTFIKITNLLVTQC